MNKDRKLFIVPPYMKAPDKCPYRKAHYPDGDYIDTIICYWVCTTPCKKFIKWEKEQRETIKANKRIREEERMASRAEYLQMCDELDIDCSDLSIKDMDKTLREEIDKQFNVEERIPADDLSDTLKKFLTEEFDYVIRDKDGRDLDWQGNVKEKRVAKNQPARNKKKKRSKKKKKESKK